MRMISTRGRDAAAPSQAILRGLAADGGLFVPEEFPRFSAEEIRRMVGMSYADMPVILEHLPDHAAYMDRLAYVRSLCEKGGIPS